MTTPGLGAAMAQIDPILALAVARQLEREGIDTTETQRAALALLLCGTKSGRPAGGREGRAA